jgi:molybdopterin converting factor small subunit
MIVRMARQLRVEVTFLSTLQQTAGCETTWLGLPQRATVAQALALLRERMPQLANVAFVATVNGAPAAAAKELGAGDGLFLMPPE